MADFGQIYNDNYKKIYSFFRQRVNHHETAEDLTADTFARALDNIDSFRQDSSFYTWLYKIAQNLLTDYWIELKKNDNIDDHYDLTDGKTPETEYIFKEELQEKLDNFNTRTGS